MKLYVYFRYSIISLHVRVGLIIFTKICQLVTTFFRHLKKVKKKAKKIKRVLK